MLILSLLLTMLLLMVLLLGRCSRPACELVSAIVLFCIFVQPCHSCHAKDGARRQPRVQIVRGPRPKSAKWLLAAGHLQARAERLHRFKGRCGSQDGFANPTRQEGRGLPPDEVMATGEGRNRCHGRFRSLRVHS